MVTNPNGAGGRDRGVRLGGRQHHMTKSVRQAVHNKRNLRHAEEVVPALDQEQLHRWATGRSCRDRCSVGMLEGAAYNGLNHFSQADGTELLAYEAISPV